MYLHKTTEKAISKMITNTYKLPRLVQGLALAFLVLLFTLAQQTAHAGGIGWNAAVIDYSPEFIPTGENTVVNVTIQNLGQATYVQLFLTDAPASWGVVNLTPQLVFMGFEEIQNFQVQVFSGVAETETIGFDLYVYQNFQDPLLVGEAQISITAKTAPEPFTIIFPTVNEVIGNELQVEWGTSFEAVDYDLTVRQMINGQPSFTPVFEVYNTTQRVHRFDASNLPLDTQFQVNVTAKNEVGQTPAAPRFFLTAPPPQLGSFSIVIPSTNQQMNASPTFIWGQSVNADSYDVTVVRGDTGADIVREVTNISSTFYVWEDPPLEAGVYRLAIVAKGMAGELLNSGGAVRFTVSELTPFSLNAPTANQTNVNRHTGFDWSPSNGADGYVFRLWQELPEGTYPYYSATVPAGSGNQFYMLPFEYNLRPGWEYSWQVEAFTEFETLLNTGGRQNFTVSPLSTFDLVSPASNEKGVIPVPTFEWDSSPGATAYLLELAPVLPSGDVDSDNIVRSQSSITQPMWESEFDPFELGEELAWRVAATDGINVEFSYGSWRKFTVDPLTDFGLSFPTENLMAVSVETAFEWEEVPGATGYILYLRIPGELPLPPINVTGGVNSYNLRNNGKHLNGNTFYQWRVEAIADGVSRDSLETRTFKTESRAVLLGCDVIDQILGRQVLSDLERVSGGLNSVIDCASYYQYLALPDAVECDN